MKTFVPMTKDQFPQQRLYEVVHLPEKPENLNIHVDWLNPLQKKRPKGSPRKLIYLCGVEWAWSPAHSRMDHYYLNLKPDHWFMWNHWLDDHSNPWRWEWIFLSYANHVGGDIKTIATHMVMDFWNNDRDHQGLDHFHLISDTGLLSVDDVKAIGRKVW